MRGKTALKSIKLLAVALSGLILFAVLFSAMFIAMEADHDCEGDDCPICECLQQCLQFLQRALGIPAEVFVTAVAFLLLLQASSRAFASPQRASMLRSVRLLC